MNKSLRKLSKAKIELGHKLGNRLAKKFKTVKVREPLYDEVYFKGVEWLNSL